MKFVITGHWLRGIRKLRKFAIIWGIIQYDMLQLLASYCNCLQVRWKLTDSAIKINEYQLICL